MESVATPDRTLPHNLEAEKCVLGAILIDNHQFNAAAEFIDDRDFFRDAHRRIWNKMVVLSERGEAIDLVTLKDELARSAELDEVGGPAYIAALTDGVPRASNVEHYAKIVKEKATLRNLIHSAKKILTSAYEAEEAPDELLDQAEKQIFEIAEDRIREGFVPLSALVNSSFSTIEKLQQHKGLVTGVPTGFADLDEMTSGLQPSDLILVAARPSMGKTSLVMNIAQHVGINTGMTVGVFSLEMSKEQLFMRMLTSEAAIDAHRFRGGFLAEKDYARLSQALGVLHDAKVFIDDTASIGVLEMRAKARRLMAQHGLHLLIIDYIQLMQGRGRFESRQQEVASISRSLKGLAKELHIPVVALSQLSRAPEGRADHRPQLSDLRECVTGDTLVVQTDGRRVPIRDLVGQTPEVWALSEEGTVVPAVSDKVWPVGRRFVYDVRLASGRSIKATAEHRLLGARGWTTVNQLTTGDRLATARTIPEPANPERWSDLRVALLGHLIGDGSYLTHQPLRYTTSSEENSGIVSRAAKEEFDSVVTRHEGPTGTWHQLVISGNGDRWHHKGVNAWLRELGIFGQRSHQKRIPEAAFRLPNDQIALLLRHLWATDGCISRCKDGRFKVYYATNSEGLARDVASLLLRIGIVARLTVAGKKGYRPGWHVRVSGAVDQLAFVRAVGAHGPRVKPTERLVEDLPLVRPNTNVDTLPREVFDIVQTRMRETGITPRHMAEIRGTAYAGSAHYAFSPSRTLLLEYAEVLDEPTLHSLATDDLFWDRIVSIDPIGEEDVFDLTVPGPACWLADGLITHNSGSLEQDADVVMFIHRQEMYDREQTKPEDQGIAELIIGKQRNGPTGSVTLTFLKQFTRFENYAAGPPQ
ncbi:MAG TPA: replicative DNA helicase [Vicinamibacterales bacterium]